MTARQEASSGVVTDLFKLWQDTLPPISGKSKLADAIRYALARRTAFVHFLADGRIEIDSNIVERAIRPKPSSGKTRSSPAVLVADEPGPRLQRSFKPPR